MAGALGLVKYVTAVAPKVAAERSIQASVVAVAAAAFMGVALARVWILNLVVVALVVPVPLKVV
ncbi:MAG: hypothetical protein ACJAQ6_000492 [Arenicella sp.]|jgi:hypothetical protein